MLPSFSPPSPFPPCAYPSLILDSSVFLIPPVPFTIHNCVVCVVCASAATKQLPCSASGMLLVEPNLYVRRNCFAWDSWFLLQTEEGDLKHWFQSRADTRMGGKARSDRTATCVSEPELMLRPAWSRVGKNESWVVPLPRDLTPLGPVSAHHRDFERLDAAHDWQSSART